MEVHSQLHAPATLSLPPPREGALGFKLLGRLKYTWLELLVHYTTAFEFQITVRIIGN